MRTRTALELVLGEHRGRTLLHPAAYAEVRRRVEGGESVAQVAADFGIAEQRAARIAATYGTSPTKARRTREEMETLREVLTSIVAEGRPMTVRQVFYRAVSMGLIAKTENEYSRTVCRLLADMRLAGELPFTWIADNTRWMRKPDTYDGVEQALEETARFYRRALWRNQPYYVEVWLEKEALASVIYDVTETYDVPLMVTRGYASLSFLHAGAQTIQHVGKPTVIYFLGDHDPSGVDIQRSVEERVRAFAPDVDVTFERLAVTPEQIRSWNLPTRPTKRTDTRARGFTGGSVEVDAIPPETLRRLVRAAIERHIDQEALEVTKAAEESERAVLGSIVLAMRREG